MPDSLEVTGIPTICVTPSQDSQGSHEGKSDGKSDRKSDGKSDKYYSASKFATDGVKVDRWLWERATIRLANLYNQERPLVDDMNGISLQIGSMVNQYEDLFQLAWPAKWSHLDPSSVTRHLTTYETVLLKKLFDQYKDFTEENKNIPIRELAETEFSTLETRLSPFLFSISMSRMGKQQTLRGLTSYEAETRMPFDLLLGLFWCSPELGVSNSYFKEGKLCLPLKNLDIPGMKTLAMKWIDLAFWAVKDRTLGDVGYEAGQTIANTAMKYRPQGSWGEQDGGESSARKKDPQDAICDGLAGTFIEAAPSSMRNLNQAGSNVSLWAAFRVVSKRDADLAVPYVCPGFVEAKEGTEGSCIEHHRECLSCTAVTSFPPMQSSVELPTVKVPSKFFPALFVEYKRSPGKKDVATAKHQCQMYCVAGVEVLHELGVDDYPVYGVTVTGTTGAIMMAWKSSKWVMGNEKEIYCNIIIDHNLPTFDLAEPLDAYRFSLAIHRIYLSQGKLRDLIDAKKLINDERKITTVE